MQTITYETALRALNEAVKAKGYNHVYGSGDGNSGDLGGCYNVTLQGEPDCIVGWALIWLGVPAEWFMARDTLEGCRRSAAAGPVCRMLKKAGMFEVDEDAQRLFRDAQEYQDTGRPWGLAVTKAHLGEDWFHSLAAR